MIEDRREEEEGQCVQGLILACQGRPHLAFSMLNKLSLRQLNQLDKTSSDMRELLQTYVPGQKALEANQLEYLAEQWFQECPQHRSREMDFNVGVMYNEFVVEYIHHRLQQFHFDEFGIVLVVKTKTGFLILIADADLTQKNVIRLEPNPLEKLCLHKSSKYLVIRQSQIQVYNRQTGKKLYSIMGYCMFDVYDCNRDDVILGFHQGGDTVDLFKLADSAMTTIYSIQECCDIMSLRCNIIPSASGEKIIRVCTQCWKVKNFCPWGSEVVWEFQLVPKIQNHEIAQTSLEFDIVSLAICQGVYSEMIFINPNSGQVLPIEQNVNGKYLTHICSRDFIVLTWIIDERHKFSVYNKKSGMTSKFQIPLIKGCSLLHLEIILENILVVTTKPPNTHIPITIMIVDISAPNFTMRKTNTPYSFIRIKDHGIMEVFKKNSGILTITQKKFKTMDITGKEYLYQLLLK